MQCLQKEGDYWVFLHSLGRSLPVGDLEIDCFE